MKTIFEKIIDREFPAQIVYEDERCIAIMDKFPVIQGQVLVIPKTPIDYMFDLDEDLYLHIFGVAKKVARALDKLYGTLRTCIFVEGFEVPHAHIKLYPITPTTQKPLQLHGGKEVSDADLEKEALQIRTLLT